MHRNGTDRFWNRKILTFLAGQTISIFGSALVQFAIIWHITLETQSGKIMTLATVFGFLPQIVISLFAGVWADRYHRKKLIILADALTATATLIIALLFLNGYNNINYLLIVLAVRSVGSGIQDPAVDAIIPQLVPKEQLVRINAFNESLQSVSFLLAPAISGALLTLFSIEAIFFIDVITASIAIIILLFLNIPLHDKALSQQHESLLCEIKKGVDYAASHKIIKSLLIYYGIFIFFVVPASQLTPLMIARSFSDDVKYLTANEMAFSIGSIVGGVVISMWGKLKNRIFAISIAFMIFGVTNAALGLSKSFTVYIIIMTISGLSLPFFNTPLNTLLQEMIEPDMRGRVFSLVQIVGTTAMPVGMIAFGWVADVVKIEYILIFAGSMTVLLSLALLKDKVFKGIDNQP